MALVSIVLSVVALVCTLIGFLTTPVPVLGLVFSFGAAAIALGGIMLGGKAQSRAKRDGVPNDMARIAVVLNVIAFVPALLVAVTCGVCNALFSTGNMQLHKDFGLNIDPTLAPDTAGAGALPPPDPAPPEQPNRPGQPNQPAQPESPKAPPGQLPPPPLPAGPGN
jgi:hypothetical protein